MYIDIAYPIITKTKNIIKYETKLLSRVFLKGDSTSNVFINLSNVDVLGIILLLLN